MSCSLGSDCVSGPPVLVSRPELCRSGTRREIWLFSVTRERREALVCDTYSSFIASNCTFHHRRHDRGIPCTRSKALGSRSSGSYAFISLCGLGESHSPTWSHPRQHRLSPSRIGALVLAEHNGTGARQSRYGGGTNPTDGGV